MNAAIAPHPLALPWLSPEHFRWPGKFNVANLDPSQVTGVLLKPSAAQLRVAFRVATETNRDLLAKDDAFEDFVYALRPGDLVVAFTRTGPGVVEDGLALFRSPNMILRQIVL